MCSKFLGHVSRLRNNWSVYEDGALAHKLQVIFILTFCIQSDLKIDDNVGKHNNDRFYP
jgi:hypothetical protein